MPLSCTRITISASHSKWFHQSNHSKKQHVFCFPDTCCHNATTCHVFTFPGTMLHLDKMLGVNICSDSDSTMRYDLLIFIRVLGPRMKSLFAQTHRLLDLCHRCKSHYSELRVQTASYGRNGFANIWGFPCAASLGSQPKYINKGYFFMFSMYFV